MDLSPWCTGRGRCGVIGLVLAAGAGRRLRPYTDRLPKALIPVDDETTILDIALRNLAAVDLRDVAVVVGFAADAVHERTVDLQARHGVRLTLIHNDKAEEWNNAYSMWLACPYLGDGAVMVNGDTVHPVGVEHSLLAARGPDIVLSVDAERPLTEEAMKVTVDDTGSIIRISKLMDPATAYAEYIGASLIEGRAVPALADALEATFRRDPDLYYEDGYQEFVDRGGVIATSPLPAGTDWVEVDDHVDLDRARVVAPGC